MSLPVVTERELVELILRAPDEARAFCSNLDLLLHRLIDRLPPEARDQARLRAQRGVDRGSEPPGCEERSERLPAWLAGKRVTPDTAVLDAARLHGRGLPPRAVPVARLAAEVALDPRDLAEALNYADLMVSFAMEAPESALEDWASVFQLAASISTSDASARKAALTAYVNGFPWEWAYLPLDAHTDAFLVWMARTLARESPAVAGRAMSSLVISPEAFGTAAGYLLPVLPELDGEAFFPVLCQLASCTRFRALALENPARALVRAIAWQAIDRSGDALVAARGLEVLFGSGLGGSARVDAADLAIVSTVAALVRCGRPGWRTPALRSPLLEAALHDGAVGCRQAALLLTAE
ncbi:MAG: hypothetical protein CMLOHMNK_03636 [Steroidobacteraceae bacterium]|nr:hypothetical protein [Steroidobacteraceae bacterium]